MKNVRSLIAVVVKKVWHMSQLDVNNAFLHGDLNDEVYMEIPQGMTVDSSELVCKLNKSLYGLKQANRRWYAKLTEALCSRSYAHSMYDYSLFYNKTENSTVYIALYVDDIVVIRTDIMEFEDLKIFLNNNFMIKDLGRLHYFLGLEVLYKDDGVIISQRKFTLDLLKEYQCTDYNSFTSPLDLIAKLKAKEREAVTDPTYYRKLVGKLNFLTNTSLDITYIVQNLSQFMDDPRQPHLKAAFHLLRYLKGDPTLGIFMSRDTNYTIRAYYDSDWATCSDSRKSLSGYLLLLGSSPVSWKSKKQDTISLSSAETEYRALRKVVGGIVVA
uniref:Uncharacterized mitochondrial protein AtMg00810-like n=1 Tax=Nicotiana tabacum TaxID=4097 RepID=A0A1S4DH07_TOBAC|nr:PREDICTED: uncharacterized mitochondrial protein AtMg00810-like [Nicotiana tabacum]